MCNEYLVPIYDDNNRLVGNVEFEDNLTVSHVPDYVNMNCLMGLKRLDETYGKLEGCIVLMFYDKYNPKSSYSEIISEKEAYRYCLNRGKLELASKLGLRYVEEVEVL